MLEVGRRVKLLIDGAQHSDREEYEKLGTGERVLVNSSRRNKLEFTSVSVDGFRNANIALHSSKPYLESTDRTMDYSNVGSSFLYRASATW